MNLELSHDLVAKEIFARFSEEEKAVRKASRMLREAFEFHQDQQKKQQEGRLLSRSEVAYIGQFLDLLNLSERENLYLDESITAVREAEEAEKRALEAKVRRQRNVVIASVIGIIITGGLSIAAVNASLEANANEELANQRLDSLTLTYSKLDSTRAANIAANYRERLVAGKGLMAQSLYEEAINEFQYALVIDSTGQEAKDSLAVCEEKSGIKSQYDGFMTQGEQFEKARNYIAALRQYRQALALRYNNAEAGAKVQTVEANLVNVFNELISGADKLKDAGQYNLAIGRYREALQIKPGNREILQKIAQCERKLSE